MPVDAGGRIVGRRGERVQPDAAAAGGRIYLFTADGFWEAVKGFDKARAYDALVEIGAAPPPGADGKRQRFMRIGGRAVKVYRIDPERLEA